MYRSTVSRCRSYIIILLAFTVMCSINNVLKCWKTVKTLKPKQRHEIWSDGMVMKVEKISV